MKLKFICTGALCTLLLAACSNSQTGSNDYKDVKISKSSTKEDSLAYMVGNMAAWQHVMMTKNDSTLSNEAAMKAYNDGYFAGLGMIKDGEEAYNKGLMAGIQSGLDIQEIGKMYDIKLSKDALASGYKADMNSKPDEMKANESRDGAMKVMRNLVVAKTNAAKDEYAKKVGFKKEGTDYYRRTKSGSGESAAKEGEQIFVKMNLLDPAGKEIMPGAGDQVNPMMIGNAPMPALNKILSLMKEGDVYELLVTGEDVFGGGRTPQNVTPLGVYTMTIERVSASEMPAPGTGQAPDLSQAPTVGQ